jgi:hypothetical protein
MEGYTCHICGQYHHGLPLSYGSSEPTLVYSIPEEQRKTKVLLSPDLCEVSGEKSSEAKSFFIAGNIEIPIIGSKEIFQWIVWVSLSQETYEKAIKLWDEVEREKEPPYFGWLSTSLPLKLYPETLNLKTNVHTRPIGIRPFIELEPTNHPLAVEQRNGITWKRVQEIAELVLHPK